MSKSKGEFLTVSLLEEKGYDPAAYRLFCLQSHYRKSLVFSWEGLDNATVAYNKLIEKIAKIDPEDGEFDEAAAEALRAKFREALDNDLNTSLAVTALYDVLKYKTNGKTKAAMLAEFDTVMTLDLLAAAEKVRSAAASAEAVTETAAPAGVDADFAAKVEALIADRAAAKAAKDWGKADSIRDELTAMGVVLKDSKEGTTWTMA